MISTLMSVLTAFMGPLPGVQPGKVGRPGGPAHVNLQAPPTPLASDPKSLPGHTIRGWLCKPELWGIVLITPPTPCHRTETHLGVLTEGRGGPRRHSTAVCQAL